MQATTLFPLKMTFAQKEELIKLARMYDVPVDKPEALNNFILGRLGV